MKYRDTVATITLGLVVLGGLFYVIQLLFMTESWLAQREIGIEAVGVAQVLGFTWLGLVLVLLQSFIKGPDGSGSFFLAFLIAQIGVFASLWYQHLTGTPAIFEDAIIVSVLTGLFLIGYFKILGRL